MKRLVVTTLAAVTIASAAEAQPRTLRDIGPGEILRGEITAGDPKHDNDTPYDAYRFLGQAGQRVTIDLQSSAFDAYLVLRRAGETRDLETDDDGGGGTNARIVFTLPATGDYEIRANAISENARGGYALSLQSDSAVAPHAAGPGQIVYGQAVSGELTAGDRTADDDTYYDVYRFTGRAGDRIRAILSSADFDAYLSLHERGASTSLKTDDDGGEGTDALLEHTLPSSGEFDIWANTVAEGETGRYTLRFEQAGSAAEPTASIARPAPIAAGQTVNGTLAASDPVLDDGSHYDLYSFQGEAGQRVVVTLRSSAFDAYLHVGRPGELEETDDDSGGGTNARVTYVLPQTGEHHIRANSFGDGESGAYTLGVTLASAQVQPIALGQSVRGELSADDPQLDDSSHYDLYRFTGRAGQRVRISLASNDFDTFLALLDADQEEVESNDDGGNDTDSMLEVTLERAGDYIIRANSLSGEAVGSYTLSLQNR